MNYNKKRRLRYWLRNELVRCILVGVGFVGFVILLNYLD